MKNIEKRKIAVFKPHDEEQGMPNNDKGTEAMESIVCDRTSSLGKGAFVRWRHTSWT